MRGIFRGLAVFRMNDCSASLSDARSQFAHHLGYIKISSRHSSNQKVLQKDSSGNPTDCFYHFSAQRQMEATAAGTRARRLVVHLESAQLVRGTRTFAAA